MKHFSLSIALTLAASAAQADLLTRWEAAEEAILERQFALYDISDAYQPWTADVRQGKACLLNAMQREFTAQQVNGYVTHLETIAAQRMSYTDPLQISSAWTAAATRNGMYFEVMAPLAASCNSSF